MISDPGGARVNSRLHGEDERQGPRPRHRPRRHEDPRGSRGRLEPDPRTRQAQDAVRRRADAIGAALVEACDLALKEAGASRADVSSFAVAAPGAVDTIKGTLLKAANLDAPNWSAVRAVGAVFPGAVGRIENDVRLAALAEARLGAGRGSNVMVAVWVGTGVGGAVIMNGRIHTGLNRNAGEIGHTQIDFRRARPGQARRHARGNVAAKVGIAAYLRTPDRPRRPDGAREGGLEEGRPPQGVPAARGVGGGRRARAARASTLGPRRRNLDRERLERPVPGRLRPRGRGRDGRRARVPRRGSQVGGRLRLHPGPREDPRRARGPRGRFRAPRSGALLARLSPRGPSGTIRAG